MKRKIKGLRWVRMLDGRPGCIPQGRPRGAKGLGVSYERALAKALPEAISGRWFEFEDSNGRGFAQPDLLVSVGDRLVVCEAKLTWTAAAREELDSLYLPLLREFLGAPVSGVVVCRNLTPSAPKSSPTLAGALAGGGLWHWLPGLRVQSCGVAPLVPSFPTSGRQPVASLESLL